jgi:rhodanese-related sulfurtransferase
MKEISVLSLKQKFDENQQIILIDVREPNEVAISAISNNIHVPLGNVGTLPQQLHGREDEEIIVYCRSGKRSAAAVQFLTTNGFTNVSNLTGGILEWKAQIDPNLPVG